jgi:NAD(P)-dependent dehydrogenase (short-subunit alcohol dehydrogenase family)
MASHSSFLRNDYPPFSDIISMSTTLAGKIIVIGGITGGIGSKLATRLAAAGATVTGYSRNGGSGEHGPVAACDATDPTQVDAYFDATLSQHGRIDAYAHALGSIYLKPAHLTSPEDWMVTLHQNLSSAFYALRACTKRMQGNAYGNLLFFSSAAAQVGIANHEAIAAAKGGLEALVRSAAATYASRGLRVNAIAPSLTDTPLAQPLLASEQARQMSAKMHPLGRIGDPDEIASLATWLLSDEAQMVTGQTFVADGGLSTILPKPR